MTLTVSFPVPPTQAYMYGWMWFAMMEMLTGGVEVIIKENA